MFPLGHDNFDGFYFTGFLTVIFLIFLFLRRRRQGSAAGTHVGQIDRPDFAEIIIRILPCCKFGKTGPCRCQQRTRKKAGCGASWVHLLARSGNSGETIDELNADIREGIDELDGKVFAVIDELPLADVIGKIVDGLDAQVREGTNDLDAQVRERIDDADFAGQADAVEISVRCHS